MPVFRRHILLVGGRPPLAARCRDYLAGAGGYAVEEAAGAHAALSRAQDNRPDAIVLDPRLADMPRQAFLGRLRGMGVDAPVVVMGEGLTPEILARKIARALAKHDARTVPPELAGIAPADPVGPPGRIAPLAEVEQAAIARALRLCGGNVAEAAARLGISPSTLYRKKAAWRGQKGGA